MKHFVLTSLAAAGLALGLAGPAAADCSAEIDQLTQRLSTSDAGSGPTAGVSEPAGGGAVTAPQAGTVPGTEATAAMTSATEGRATSPADVQRQTEGEPTAADAGAAADGTTSGSAEVMSKLADARAADEANDEQACMRAVEAAKTSLDG